MNKKIILPILIIILFSTLRATFAQTRLGVLYTQEELTIWRQRAQSGPYKTFGDVSTNSPADWTRILKNANDFLLDPTSELTSSTFAIGYATEPKTGWRMRDAAFVSLILAPSNPTKSAQYAKAVRTTLLAQCRSSHTNFTTYEYFGDLAGWVIAEFMVRQLFAYDYIKDAGVLTTAEKAELNAWFYNAANFFARNLHTDLADLFPKRLTGDYSVKTGVAGLGTTSAVEYTHVNADGSKGNSIMSLARYYNNRRASHALIVGLVDVFLKNVGYTAAPVKTNVNGVSNTTPLEVHAKNFVKEWVKYSVYPDGMQGEFERSNVENPFKGFNYSTCNLFVASLMADAYARRGDFELYNFTTSEGLWGSQGGSKSIRLAVETNLKMVDGSIKRYYGTVNENNRYRNVQYLNDNLNYVSDIWYAFANVYWKSSYQKGVYTRTGPGTVTYPATRIGSTAGLNPWGGTADMLPGCLFMFGGMEGKVWPYPSSPNPTPDPVQLPVPVIAKSGSTTFCEGGSVTLSAPTGYTAYVWSNGATTKDISATANGSYTVKVKDQNGNVSPLSAPVDVTVTPAPAKPTITASGSVTFNEGGSVVLNAPLGSNYSYTWYKNNAVITNAITNTYTATTTGNYTVVITQNGCKSVASAALTVTVNSTLPSAAITYEGNLSFCTGGSIVLKASTGSGYVYQWKMNGNNITNATSSTFTATQSGKYTVQITQNQIKLPLSNEVAVSVAQSTQAVIVAAGSTSLCGGGFVVLKANSGTGFTYQWQKDGVDIPNAITAVYEVNQSGAYSVNVTQNTCGNSKSNTIKVEVNPATKPVITALGSTSLCEGNSVVLQVPTGTGFSYRWKRNGVEIPYTNAASYKVVQSGDYTVQVTSNGCPAPLSDAVKVTVNNVVHPAITYNGNKTICEGGSVTLQSTSGNQYVYQWKKDGIVIPNAVTATYVATQAGKYTIEIIQNGCTSTPSNMIEVINGSTIKPSATITASGTTTVCAGNSVILQANSGAGLTYQWQKDGSAIANATTATYLATQSGDYTVKVSLNNCTSSLSAAVSVSVITLAKPGIYSDDSNVINKGESVLLSTSAVGGATYQWLKDGKIITKATERTYSTNQPGTYTLQITKNGCSSAVSDGYIIVTKEASSSMQSLTASGKTIFCEGGSVKLSAPQGYKNYKWSSGETSREITVNSSGAYYATATKDNKSYTFTTISIKTVSVPEKPVITKKGDKLVASANRGYQWYLNGQKIANAVNQEYKPTQAGTYSVAAHNAGGCSTSSDEIAVTKITDTEGELANAPTEVGEITAYPNPSQGVFHISAQVEPETQGNISVISADGSNCYKRQFTTTGNVMEEVVDISYARKGIYLIRLEVGKDIIMKRVMKE